MPPNFSHTDDFVEDLKDCVVQVTCARCCFLAQCSDEGMRTKLATADEKGINRGKEGRKEGVGRHWLDCSLLLPLSPVDTPTHLLHFIFSASVNTAERSATNEKDGEVRCQEKESTRPAPLGHVGKRGTGVQGCREYARLEPSPLRQLWVWGADDCHDCTPCHPVTTLIFVTHQHQHQHQHQPHPHGQHR